MSLFTKHEYKNDELYSRSVDSSKRGSIISIKDMYGAGSKITETFVNDSKAHDANFAFLKSDLAKLYTQVVEPKYFTTYTSDVDIDVGGGFVDYVSYYEVNWAAILNEINNVMGNNANVLPRVNAGMNQKKVDVYTLELGYDVRFIELEKAKQVDIKKSLEQIYGDIIVASSDIFNQKVAYVGMNGKTGLFNSDAKVYTTTIDNSGTTGKGFQGLTDDAIAAWLNGAIATYLKETGHNLALLPNRILVPSFVGSDLSARMSALYTASLRSYLVKHNMAVDESEDENYKLTIVTRSGLDELGTAGKGRIVMYRKDKTFVRMDLPYPMQHFITLPNIERMGYTSVFVEQVSELQMPYNASSSEFGVVTYWDFTD
jgi:hypothetical protein